MKLNDFDARWNFGEAQGLGKHFEDESPGFMSKMRRGRNPAAHFAVPLTL
jgi:hypothetical protein